MKKKLLSFFTLCTFGGLLILKPSLVSMKRTHEEYQKEVHETSQKFEQKKAERELLEKQLEKLRAEENELLEQQKATITEFIAPQLIYKELTPTQCKELRENFLRFLMEPLPEHILMHAAEVNAAQFNPDGSKVVTGGWDGRAKIWNVETGKELHTLRGHQTKAWIALFSPDGKKVITGSTDGKAKIWDAETGKRLKTLQQGGEIYPWVIVLSPDSSMVLVGSDDDIANVWDMATGNLLKTIEHGGPIRGVAWSADGRTFATGGEDGTVMIWDANTMTQTSFPTDTKILDSPVVGIALSPDNAHIAVTTLKHKLYVYPLAGGQPWITSHDLSFQSDLQNDDFGLWGLAYSPDGTKIATGSYTNKDIKIWNVATKKLLAKRNFSFPVRSIVFSPDSKKLGVSLLGPGALILDAGTGEILYVLKHDHWVWPIAFNRDGSKAVTGSRDGTAKIWDITENDRVYAFLKNISIAQCELLRAVQMVIMREKALQAMSPEQRGERAILEPIHLSAEQSHLFTKLPQSIQQKIKRYVVLYEVVNPVNDDAMDEE